MGWRCDCCHAEFQGTDYSFGGFSPLCYPCLNHLKSRETQPVSNLIKSDGGSTDYYKLPDHATELRHLISHKGMSKSRGDVFKACYRLGEKDGAEILYDLRKMKFFVEDLIEMYERGERL